MAAPDDDLVRLAFADWLEEHGEPDRAEFIRVQIELARLPARHGDRPPLERREGELFAAGRRGRVLGPFTARGRRGWAVGLPGVRGHLSAWRRGFPAAARFPAPRYLDRVGPLSDREPVGGVTLDLFLPYLDRPRPTGRRDAALAERLAADPRAGLVTATVGGGGPTGSAMLLTLLWSPHLTRLRDVHLAEDHLGPAGVRALCASPAVAAGGVRSLSLYRAFLDYDAGRETPDVVAAVEALAASPHLAGLEHLDLSWNGLGAESARLLLASPHLSRTLDLRFDQDDPAFPVGLAAALAERFNPARPTDPGG